MDENPDKRPNFGQIANSFLTDKEKTWLNDVNENEVDKYLHKFGLTTKPQKQTIDFEFIESIDNEKYPIEAF